MTTNVQQHNERWTHHILSKASKVSFTVTLQDLQHLTSADYSAPYFTNRHVQLWRSSVAGLKTCGRHSFFLHFYLKHWRLVLPMLDFRCLSPQHANKLSSSYSITIQGWKLQLVHVGKQTQVSNSNSFWLFEVNCGEWCMCSVWLCKADFSSLTGNLILRGEPTGMICAFTNCLEVNPDLIFTVSFSAHTQWMNI